MPNTATARQGDTIAAICWRELGRTRGVTEQVFALNPGIAALGPRLPAGTVITLPDLTEAAPAVLETVKLWD
ncbi:tail protein X [Novosphingobium guangzhouense]|uniref:Phage tail protein n=1 Tax=Novosphingobium guangzhouense TaxID=1850347 RepID=A0A2K2G664_9SPHN|nr:tail protein X [Novosphingobium guangzhouense]PNU06478.1 phage tail protein [Novosphingobium guangzhouense]